jgi:hypothetical protein
MNTFSRLTATFACAAAFSIAGCAQNEATGTPAEFQTNESGYLRPHYLPTRGAVRPAFRQDYGIGYKGGPVLTKPRLYLIFWGWHAAGDPNVVKPLLLHYARSIGGSGYNNIYTQYYGPSGNIKNPHDQYGAAWFDDTHAIPAQPTDKQVAAEALRFIKQFGYDANGAYVVATAHDHSTNGFGTKWCAYHSATTDGSRLVPYINLPYVPDAAANCGANYVSPPSDESGANEGVSIVLGQEYGDTITDPQPGTGWDTNGEIGGLCVWFDIQNDPYGKQSYTAQPMFSNASSSCVHSYQK